MTSRLRSVLAASGLAGALLLPAAVQAQVHGPFDPSVVSGGRVARIAASDVRPRVGAITESLSAQGFRLLPGESYKAIHEKASIAMIAPKGEFAAAVVPEESCLDPKMAIVDRTTGQRYPASAVSQGLVARFTAKKDHEVFIDVTSGDSRCFAYLLGYRHP